MASGAEEERVRREIEEEEEDVDERPQLSVAAAMALREFLEQRVERENGGGDEGRVELVAEDCHWRLRQFWYDEGTARELAEEVYRLASGLPGASVACVRRSTRTSRRASGCVPAQLLTSGKRTFGKARPRRPKLASRPGSFSLGP
jgi:hypothetical protein